MFGTKFHKRNSMRLGQETLFTISKDMKSQQWRCSQFALDRRLQWSPYTAYFLKVKDNGYEVTHDGKCITVFR